MAFSKKNFVDNQTVIDAATLNAIQDELIRVAGLLGKDIQSATIDNSGHLILTLTDGTTLDAGVAKGSDGVTPHIGDNGNWYLGSTDPGKPSRGATGAQGPKGDTGGTGPRGPAGSDASVTAENIEAAMGYRPADPTKYLPLTGGKLTGNLEGKYIAGTWLKSTDAGHQEAAATKWPYWMRRAGSITAHLRS